MRLATRWQQIQPNGVAFTGECKLVPKPTGYEHKKLSPRYPAFAGGCRHSIDRSPIFYGTSAQYRFDDLDAKYGVLYVATDPFGAFVETFGQFMTTVEDLNRKVLRGAR